MTSSQGAVVKSDNFAADPVGYLAVKTCAENNYC